MDFLLNLLLCVVQKFVLVTDVCITVVVQLVETSISGTISVQGLLLPVWLHTRICLQYVTPKLYVQFKKGIVK